MTDRPAQASLHLIGLSSPRRSPGRLRAWLLKSSPATKQLSITKHTQNTQLLDKMGTCPHLHLGTQTHTMNYTHSCWPQLEPKPWTGKWTRRRAHANTGHSRLQRVPIHPRAVKRKGRRFAHTEKHNTDMAQDDKKIAEDINTACKMDNRMTKEKFMKFRKLAAEVKVEPNNKHGQYQIKGPGLVLFHFL